MQNAFAIACDRGYLPGLKALLNSIFAYHGATIPVFLYLRGISEDQVGNHPIRPLIRNLDTMPWSPPGMWEAKQLVFADCMDKARCVYLLDADVILTSRLDDVFELAAEGKIVSSLDGEGMFYRENYAVYSPAIVGQKYPYINSGALCLDVIHHWDLVGLWSFAARVGGYSPGNAIPLRLPGHGDQGVFNALAAKLNKVKDFHPLPEGTWCDSSKGCEIRIVAKNGDGTLAVWNETDNAPQRILHSTGPKWWTVNGERHLAKFRDKYACFRHFSDMGK